MTRRRPRWGQHFLVNAGVADAIVDAACREPFDSALEIGPGRGVLTVRLVARFRRVLAVEIDADLADRLPGVVGRPERLVTWRRDAVELDWPSAVAACRQGAAPGAPATCLVANLPYEVSAPLLLAYLRCSSRDRLLGRAVVMVQAEMADRLAAAPGSRAYGSLGAVASCTHAVEKVMDVGPGSFQPPPRVRSRVLALAPRSRPAFGPIEWDRHARFIHRAFAHRRKQLARSLAGTCGLSREEWRCRIEDLGRPGDVRAEALSPEELVALSASAGAP